MVREYLLLSIVLVLMLTLNACGLTGPKAGVDEEVIFPDKRLEATIREAIDKPEGPISPSDLKALTSLRYTPTASDSLGKFITDLTGLEHCTSLTDLNLSKTQVSDVSLLASLTNLTELSLEQNEISDISPLGSLTNLTRLSLKWNEISDISPLASLANLTELNLWKNKITDVTPLASLTNLTELNLAANNISDISPLVETGGLSEGDAVYLLQNPLSETSKEVSIPELQERGVEVTW